VRTVQSSFWCEVTEQGVTDSANDLFFAGGWSREEIFGVEVVEQREPFVREEG
jgi:hypothetical protein